MSNFFEQTGRYARSQQCRHTGGRWGRPETGLIFSPPPQLCYSCCMTRRTPDARTAAEKAFKAVTAKPAELPPKAPVIPGAKETVSLRIDRDVLDFFQEDGPGWQERINAALRKAAGK